MINPVSFQSIPIINTPERRAKAVKVAAPALLTSTAVMVATRAAKNANGQKEVVLDMSKRLSRAGIAGLTAAALASALTFVNKENIVQGVNRVKEVFRRNQAEKDLDNTKPVEGNKQEAETKAQTEEAGQKEKKESLNPFSENNEQALELDKSVKEALQAAESNEPIKEAQNIVDNPGPNQTKQATPFFNFTPNEPLNNANGANPFSQQ